MRITKRASIAGRAKNTEVLEWEAEGMKDGELVELTILITINADKYWEGVDRAQDRATQICEKVFGVWTSPTESTFSGPYLTN